MCREGRQRVKLVMITINGVARFVRMAPDGDGKFRVTLARLERLFEGTYRRGDCIRWG